MKATASRRREVGRKPEIKTVSLRKERAYKANDPDKLAQHSNVHGSGSGVNAQAAQLKFAFLSGETSIPCGPSQSGSGPAGNGWIEDGGVSRGP